MYLGRGNHYEGAWEASKLPSSSLRIRDRYLEYYRKYLVGKRISELKIDKKDRILIIPYQNKNNKDFLMLFYKGRELFFANSFTNSKGDKEIFLSWQSLEKHGYSFETSEDLEMKMLSYFDIIGRGSLSIESARSVIVKYDEVDNYLANEVEKLEKVEVPKKRIKFLKRKESRIQDDLKKVSSWPILREAIESSSFEIGCTSVMMLHGIKFKFDQSWNEYKKKDIIYSKIKKMKKGENILKGRLEECRNELLDWQIGNICLEKSKAKIISPYWNTKSKKTKILKDNDHNIEEFIIDNNTRIGIGKSTHGNDFLRNEWGSKSDFWFHLDGYKSAHCVIKSSSNMILDEEKMQIIGSALRDFSSLTILNIPIIYTQIKNLKGIKGKPGSVTYKKVKHIMVNYVDGWKEKLIL